jgi:hypothetical protein
LIAFFAVAQGSAVYPYGPYGAWPYAAPIAQYASVPSVYGAPVAWASHVSAAHPAAIQVAGYPYAAPSVYAHPAVVPVAKVAATYTAATRGAVHTAPLEGHVISRTNINTAPAPGTY